VAPNGSAIAIDDAWPEGAEDYDYYSMTNLATMYVFFLFVVPFQFGAIFILKRNLVRDKSFLDSYI